MSLAIASALATALYLGQMAEPAQAAPAVAPVPAAAAAAADEGAARLPRARDGHYWAQAKVDGRVVRMMVDTGASLVVLTRDDARRLGFRLGEDDFTDSVTTASGAVRAAPVRLSAVAVGSARVSQVEALVVESGLPHSLLGMSYLGRLSAFTATPAAMTLQG